MEERENYLYQPVGVHRGDETWREQAHPRTQQQYFVYMCGKGIEKIWKCVRGSGGAQLNTFTQVLYHTHVHFEGNCSELPYFLLHYIYIYILEENNIPFTPLHSPDVML